jgi:hypothetical protein
VTRTSAGSRGRKSASLARSAWKFARELEEDGAQPIAEAAGGVDHPFHGLLGHGQSLDVRHIAAALHGEAKTIRYCACPGFELLARGLPVERIVQRNRVELGRIQGQLVGGTQFRWVEPALPVAVHPAGRPNANASHTSTYTGAAWSPPLS